MRPVSQDISPEVIDFWQGRIQPCIFCMKCPFVGLFHSVSLVAVQLDVIHRPNTTGNIYNLHSHKWSNSAVTYAITCTVVKLKTGYISYQFSRNERVISATYNNIFVQYFQT